MSHGRYIRFVCEVMPMMGALLVGAAAGCDSGQARRVVLAVPTDAASPLPDTPQAPTAAPGAMPSPSPRPTATAAPTPTPALTSSPTASPAPTATPDPTFSPPPTPTPTPSPTPTPPRAISLVVMPADYPALALPAAPGAARPAGYPDSLQFKAYVWFADESTGSAATWTSDSPQIASVSSTGLVKAVGAGPGRGPWTVSITARSLDKQVSHTREIVVEAIGDLELRVE